MVSIASWITMGKSAMAHNQSGEVCPHKQPTQKAAMDPLLGVSSVQSHCLPNKPNEMHENQRIKRYDETYFHEDTRKNYRILWVTASSRVWSTGKERHMRFVIRRIQVLYGNQKSRETKLPDPPFRPNSSGSS